MRKNIFILSLAAAALFFGCAKQEINDIQNDTVLQKISLKVKAENNTTKGDYSSTGQFTWRTGDQIGVHMWKGTDRWPQPLDLTAGADNTEGTFETTTDGDWGVVAFYPWNGYRNDLGGTELPEAERGTHYSDPYGGGDGNLYIHMKESISYANSAGNPQQLLPLVAQLNSNNVKSGIEFKQVGSGIKVKVKNVPAWTDKVSLTIAGKNITGWFPIKPADAGTASISASDGSNSTVSITFDASSSARDMTFTFPLPTLTFSSLTLKLYVGSNEFWSKSAAPTTAQTLGKGDILVLPDVTVSIIKAGISTAYTDFYGASLDGFQVHWWNSTTNGDVNLVSTGHTEEWFRPEDSVWAGYFSVYYATIPSNATGYKLHKGDNWQGDDGSVTKPNCYIYNWGGNHRVVYD